jgi:hypothetical protein
MVRAMKRSSRFASLAALAALACGCSTTFTQQPGGGYAETGSVLQTPGGLYPIYTPPLSAPPPPPGLAAPPPLPGQAGGGLPSPGGGALDGTYDGEASLTGGFGAECAFRFSMTNLHVYQGRVRFAGFHGTIGPDGGVRMADGSANWITGHFSPGQFNGYYTNRYCAYSLALDRVGP